MSGNRVPESAHLPRELIAINPASGAASAHRYTNSPVREHRISNSNESQGTGKLTHAARRNLTETLSTKRTVSQYATVKCIAVQQEQTGNRARLNQQFHRQMFGWNLAK